MRSSSNERSTPANQRRTRSVRITLPTQKRTIDSISQDSDSELELRHEKSQRSDDLPDEPVPSETYLLLEDVAMDVTLTAAAVDTVPNGDQDPPLVINEVVLDYLKTCLSTILDYYLRQYRSSRYELRRRSVSLSVLQDHQARGTLPRDLDFKLGVANPYRSIHKNRDELLKREQQIVQDAKLQILLCRIEAAASAVHQQEQMIQTKFPVDDYAPFRAYTQEKLQPLMPPNFTAPATALINKTWDDYCTLYLIKLAEQKNNLDAKFAALDAKHAESLKKSAKTTPLVHTLNESDFQAKLLQALKGLVEEHTQRPRKKPVEPSPAPTPPSPPIPASDSGKKTRRNRRKSQKIPPPSSETPKQTKPDSSKRRSYSSVISSAPPSAPPSAPTSSAPRVAKTNSSSSSHRHVSYDHDNVSDDENDGSWTQVRHQKNRRSGKNAQAQDNRNVPKQTQVRRR